MKSRTLRRATTGIAALGLLGGSTLVGFGPSTLAGAALPDGETFGFTGETQTWVVPDGVCEVDIVALGAAGGTGVNIQEGSDMAAPGRGGSATVTIDVAPGGELQVNVGGRGGDGTPDYDIVPTPGGWNGGGDAGETAGHSGGGGGASDVRQGGTDLDDRVVAAGGGGGSGAISRDDDLPLPNGGNGGNPAAPGADGASFEPMDPAGGGGAGTETAGGAGGAGVTDGADSAPSGADGTLGQGGTGGGGGTFAIELFGGGGGGSSLGDSTEAGVNDGDGEVTITPSGDCDTDIPDEPTTTTPGEQPNDGGQARPATPVTARPAYTG